MSRILGLFISLALVAPAWGRLPDGVQPQDDPNNNIGNSVTTPQASKGLDRLDDGFANYRGPDITTPENDGAFNSAALEGGTPTPGQKPGPSKTVEN